LGKAPAFQFYVKDWLSDPQLRMASPSTRGIWIDLLCFMWWQGKVGKLELSNAEITKLTGANNGDVELFIKEALKYNFCDISVTSNEVSQIYNRRMMRECKHRESNRKRQKKHREKGQSNRTVTPPSPTPSPSPPPKPNKYTPEFSFFWDSYPKKIGKLSAYKSWLKIKPNRELFQKILKAIKEQTTCDQWCKDNGQFIPNPATWLNQGRWDDEIKKREVRDWRKDILNGQ